MELKTTASNFGFRFLNLVWRDSTFGNPYTQAFAYIDSVSTNITGNGTLIIDSSNIILPVELSDFTSDISRNNVSLSWLTSLETDNSGFNIERLSNSKWSIIGFIKGNGTSSLQNSYSFEDKNLNPGAYKYRLKQIDYNGNYRYYDLQNEVVISIPQEFRLKQNYPNPFNPFTKIDFDIPENGFVSLKIFDLNGKEIKVLVSEFKNSGYYSVELNASELPSGAYFYRFESGNFITTKKLVLLK